MLAAGRREAACARHLVGRAGSGAEAQVLRRARPRRDARLPRGAGAMVGQPRRPPARAAVDAGAVTANCHPEAEGRRTFKVIARSLAALGMTVFVLQHFLPMRRCGGHDPPPVLIALALSALANSARAKDELVLGMTQTPGTWNPLISSMLAKSLISNMTARPLTAYDAASNLVCLVCTEVATIENGKARVIDLPDDGREAARRAWRSTSSCATCAGATACRSPPRTWPSPSRSASTRCRAWLRPKATSGSSSSTPRTIAISP